MRRVPPALALVCAAGAALRFATLDLQSLWYDETVTAQLMRSDLPGLLAAIPGSESSPPLYYLLAWLWTHLFGTGEVGLRSLSALLGTATIAVVWALGRRLGGERAATIAALLVAVNALLVWFSQEARAYALLALLAALSALLWLRALERPGAGRAAAWSLVAAMALATHYYAVFLVVAQALWLVLRVPAARVRAAALVPLAAALAALAPLALSQRANDSAAFIDESSLATRLAQVPKQLLVGYDAPAETLLAVLSALAALIAAGGIGLLVARREQTASSQATGPAARRSAPGGSSWKVAEHPPADGSAPSARSDALRLAAVTMGVVLLAAIAAVAGEDHLITRNVLVVAPLGAALAGAGLAAVERARPALGRSAIAAACLLGLVAVAGVATDPRLQRDDWRAAVGALGRADGDRLLVASPGSALVPLRYYLPSARPLAAPALLTSEVDYMALAQRSPGERPAPPRPPAAVLPGFALAGRTDGETFTVLRMRAPVPQAVALEAVGSGLDGKPVAVLVAAR